MSGKRVRVAEGHVTQRGSNRIHDADAFLLPHTAGGGMQEEEEEEEMLIHKRSYLAGEGRGRGNTYSEGGGVRARLDVGGGKGLMAQGWRQEGTGNTR